MRAFGCSFVQVPIQRSLPSEVAYEPRSSPVIFTAREAPADVPLASALSRSTRNS